MMKTPPEGGLSRALPSLHKALQKAKPGSYRSSGGPAVAGHAARLQRNGV
jgi:hypothetical protein